jgi:hypothetical protein
MKIGIMSDSHDNLPNIRKVLALFAAEGCGALIHAGDFVAPFAVKEILAFAGPAYGVFGNNDGEKAGIMKLWQHVFCGPYLFELGGLRILVCHDETELARAPYERIDVRIFGHDHKAEVKEGRPLDINPGESGGWLYGKATCAVLDTAGPKAKILEIK